MEKPNKTELCTFGGGCFWCTEAIFQSLKGVLSVESGYSGGDNELINLNDVHTGRTGYAEVIQIEFDPTQITYKDLLDIFFETHDPTAINKQGYDIGSQYRSLILYHSEDQKSNAEKAIEELSTSGKYKERIATEIKKYTSFYKAEKYHQNYYLNNPGNLYCTFIISPKLKKLREKFAEKLK